MPYFGGLAYVLLAGLTRGFTSLCPFSLFTFLSLYFPLFLFFFFFFWFTAEVLHHRDLLGHLGFDKNKHITTSWAFQDEGFSVSLYDDGTAEVSFFIIYFYDGLVTW